MGKRETELRVELNTETQSRLVTQIGCSDFLKSAVCIFFSRGVQV